jgi:signal transduction histidine kinase
MARKSQLDDPDFMPLLVMKTRNLGSSVEIRVRDNGSGVTDDTREKMFNPFFTTKPAGEGTGLGLSISHDIVVKQHGGRLEVSSVPGSHTELVDPPALRPSASGGQPATSIKGILQSGEFKLTF